MQTLDDENLTYAEFIENILNTRGRFNCGDEYHERHHIIPKCMGGTNDKNNLIDLFAREHFIAHKMLAEENPDNNGLVYGWTCMAFVKNNYQERYEITSEEYEMLKKIMNEMCSGENAHFYGKHHSNETKKKQSEIKKGARNPNYGKHYSEEERRRLSELLSGENGPMYGKHHSEETRRKIGEAATNPSKETRQKMREAKMGIYNGANNPRAKMVICLGTKEIYGAASIASEKTGINEKNICRCCRGERKSAGGYEWKFIYDGIRKDGTLILGALSLGLITESELTQKTNATE